jgi:hypothetical protein
VRSTSLSQGCDGSKQFWVFMEISVLFGKTEEKSPLSEVGAAEKSQKTKYESPDRSKYHLSF